MFTEPMTSTYDLNIGLIIGNVYNYVIDTGLGSGSIKPILEYLSSDSKPVVVVNTHCHWDHIWGNFMFKGSMIIASPLCRELQDKHWEDALIQNRDRVDGEIEKCVANTILDGSLFFPDDGVTIFSAPGHGWDDISVYDAIDKVLYVGDNVGDTDDEIVPWIGTDMGTFREMINTYRNYDFDFCVSGHNKPQDKTVLSRMDAALADAWKKQVNDVG
jgi:glyoxylase-like metal-dependent hydrolase (beta-lactamase superfamily II)